MSPTAANRAEAVFSSGEVIRSETGERSPAANSPGLSCSGNYNLRIGLLTTYFVYAILLNSASLMLMQQRAQFALSDTWAKLIPEIPELTILALALVIASYLGRLGFRRAVLISVLGMTLTCALVPTFPQVSTMVVMFVFGGATFVAVKIATYSLVVRVTSNPRSHASFLCALEAVFMAGILAGNLLFFHLFGKGAADGSWINAFYPVAGLAALAFVFIKRSQAVDSAPAAPSGRPSVREMTRTVRLVFTPLVVAFIVSNLLYVMSEQCAVSWFAAYDRAVVHLPLSLTATQMITCLIVAAGLGRCVAALVIRWLHWLTVVLGCLFAVSALVLFILPLGGSSSTVYCLGNISAPLAAFVLPWVVFFLAPIYPAINSVALTATSPAEHARMSGLIMFFSAVGGIAGKMITSRVFAEYGGESALYLSLVSIGALVIALFYFDRLVERRNGVTRGLA